MFARRFAGCIPREPMKMNCNDHRFQDALGILGKETGYHAGEDVAGPACRHAGITRGVHPYLAIRLGNQGPMALEHNNDAMLAGICPSHIQPIPLHSSD